jgi:hypothetical protein
VDRPRFVNGLYPNDCPVKFDTAKLPPILNALETTNNGQKLVLEVAVRVDGTRLHRWQTD